MMKTIIDMPTYNFRNKETQEEVELFMSISAREQYLSDNPHMEQIPCAPAISYNDMKKPDDGFRDILRGVQRKYKTGIETF